jgi:hypothetical protein
MDKRLSGLQSRSGQRGEEKTIDLTGTWTRTPLCSSRYTDYAGAKITIGTNLPFMFQYFTRGNSYLSLCSLRPTKFDVIKGSKCLNVRWFARHCDVTNCGLSAWVCALDMEIPSVNAIKTVLCPHCGAYTLKLPFSDINIIKRSWKCLIAQVSKCLKYTRV